MLPNVLKSIMKLFTLVFLKLDIKLSCSFRVFSFLDLEPVVSNFFGKVLKEGLVRSQQVQWSVVVVLTLKNEKIILP